VPHRDLSGIADIFADELPADTFSPADIQGFLLERKHDPERALADIRDWRDEFITFCKAT
jgi:chaperone BCS1